MSQSIKNAGLKVTGPRTKILKIMEERTSNNDVHLSAEDVYRILLLEDEENVGLATVYRVLTQFAQAGILKRHNFEGNHSVFEINQEGDHHNHLVCVKTGKVIEFRDEIIEKRQREIAAENGFILEDYRLVLYGIYAPEKAKK